MRSAILALSALAVACAPVSMSATDAAMVLEAFTAGAPEAVDVCKAEGRNQLRGAVRAYGEAMHENGQDWPALVEPDERQEPMSAMEITVLIAFAAGFVQASDLQQPARGRAQRLAFAHLPHMIELRGVAMDACPDVVAMQRAASRYMLEMERYAHVVESARRNGGEAAVGRILSQNAVLKRAQEDMERAAALIQARMGE